MPESYTSLLSGDIPPWVMRFVKGVGKTVNTYSMIHEGDTVLLGVSGGKDSLALALALSMRRKWMPVTYTLKAVMIDWIEHPIEKEYREKLHAYFSSLDIDFTILERHQFQKDFSGKYDCYLCSRNRRRILFEYANEHDISLIAMGHHLDDMVETTMMNLFFRAKFSSFLPIQDFFDGKIKIIRPLIETRENVTIRLKDNYDLPVVKPVCPYDQTNVRARLKPIVKELSHIDPLSREHVYKAMNYKTEKK